MASLRDKLLISLENKIFCAEIDIMYLKNIDMKVLDKICLTADTVKK